MKMYEWEGIALLGVIAALVIFSIGISSAIFLESLWRYTKYMDSRKRND